MAGALSTRTAAATVDRTGSFFRVTFSILRNLSTSTGSTANQSDSGTVANSTKPRRKKKKNLFEVAQFLPNWGVGYHMAKTHWTNVSYEITKINLYKDGRHGKAWGTAYVDGVPANAPKKISGVHKRCWGYIPNLKKSEDSSTFASTSSPSPKPEVQAE